MNVDTVVDAVVAGHAERLAGIDSLLPASALPRDPGTVLRVPDAVGFACRVAVDRHTRQAPWRPLVEYRLDARLSGEDPGRALGELLDAWESHLAGVAEPGDRESSAVVSRPSRDSAGSTELLHRGFAPTLVVAVRPAERMAAGPAPTPGVRIRAGERADLDTAVRLQLELHGYDADFGAATARSGTREILADELAEQLSSAEPSVWIAELYGRPLGLVQVQLPRKAEWARQFVVAERVGYLQALAVAEEARSSGLGTALAAHAHQVFDEAGAEVVLLQHALANPRSTPFWYAQGYRPLWTQWRRRPAVP